MKTTLFILLFLSLTLTSLFAQEGYEHLSPIAHGAGRTYVVTSRGLDAVGLNPALLEFENDKTLEIQIFPLSTYGLDAGPSFSDANALSSIFSTGISHFTDSSLTNIANLLSNGKLSGRGDAEILGVSYRFPEVGTFAFTWTTHGAVRTDIPQSFLDFAKSAAHNLIQSPSSIDNFEFQGMWYNEYSLTYAKTIEIGKDSNDFLKNISVGGAIKYVSGIAYLKVDQGNYIHTMPGNERIIFNVNFDEHAAYSSNFDPRHVPNHFSFDFLTSNSAGSGMGADIGVCFGFLSNRHGTPTVLLGVSATDIGSITWNKNATERIVNHMVDTILYKSGDITDSLKSLGGLLKDVSSFTSPLPSMFRAGFMIDLDAMGVAWGAFAPKIALEYANGLTSLVGSLKSGRLGAGLTLERTGPVGLRLAGGFVIESGASDLTLGCGITLFQFLNIDVASAHIGQFFKSGSSRTDLALGIRAAF
ncbi:MAG: DUF5723 family protein [Bacteroidota bacterium]|nr:DUF5723 family protein [Bacteroidota bacterium]MDP4229175.1 DUF5723 family protein [Bacteroidota bacterium]MDP4237675.1 DUF5723 family protein [Bacteroidota bacterium]